MGKLIGYEIQKLEPRLQLQLLAGHCLLAFYWGFCGLCGTRTKCWIPITICSSRRPLVRFFSRFFSVCGECPSYFPGFRNGRGQESPFTPGQKAAAAASHFGRNLFVYAMEISSPERGRKKRLSNSRPLPKCECQHLTLGSRVSGPGSLIPSRSCATISAAPAATAGERLAKQTFHWGPRNNPGQKARAHTQLPPPRANCGLNLLNIT